MFGGVLGLSTLTGWERKTLSSSEIVQTHALRMEVVIKKRAGWRQQDELIRYFPWPMHPFPFSYPAPCASRNPLGFTIHPLRNQRLLPDVQGILSLLFWLLLFQNVLLCTCKSHLSATISIFIPANPQCTFMVLYRSLLYQQSGGNRRDLFCLHIRSQPAAVLCWWDGSFINYWQEKTQKRK